MNSFNENTIKYFAIQIANGMQVMVQSHLAHLDIKPDNILLVSGVNAKLGDFTLTKFCDINSEVPFTSKSGSYIAMGPEYYEGKIKEKDIFLFSYKCWNKIFLIYIQS